MSQQLTLELSDELYAVLQQQAMTKGFSVAEYSVVFLTQQHQLIAPANLPDRSDSKEAHQRLLSYAGVISLGAATGADNDSIDADLAKAYNHNFSD